MVVDDRVTGIMGNVSNQSQVPIVFSCFDVFLHEFRLNTHLGGSLADCNFVFELPTDNVDFLFSCEITTQSGHGKSP